MSTTETKLNENMAYVPAGRVKHIAKILKKHPDDTQVSLEFILTALFPTVWENIKIYGKDCYTAGYLQ